MDLIDDHQAWPRCSFYEKQPDGECDRIMIKSPRGDDTLRTPTPPALGDVIFLFDQRKGKSGYFKVLERRWLYSSYGSADWPVIRPYPKVGPLVEFLVEIVDRGKLWP